MSQFSYFNVFIVAIICSLLHFSDCFIRVKRIIGGEPDNSDDQKFLAALIGEKGYSWDVLRLWGEHRKLYCSGSLIHDQWIVTAAHCFTTIKETEEEEENVNNENENISNNDEETELEEHENETSVHRAVFKTIEGKTRTMKKEIIDFSDPSYWKVRLAVKNLKPTLKEKLEKFINKFFDKPNNIIYHDVSKIIRHPMYHPFFLENDIALIKLKKKLNMSNSGHSRIISITKSNIFKTLWPYPGQICKVLGWGCKKFEGPIMNQLHSVSLPILNSTYCRSIYRTDINLTEQQEFCAGYHSRNKGICAGDSGGPIICSENGKFVLAGVVSATHVNNPDKYPGIFSRISYFSSWINKIIEKN